MKAGVGVLAVWSFAAGFGCGGDRDDACGRTQPCGGDPVGSWTIEDSCSSTSPVVDVGLSWPYCVDGPAMHLMALDGTNIVDDVVLAKQ